MFENIYLFKKKLINFFNLRSRRRSGGGTRVGSTASGHTTGHTAGHAAGHTTFSTTSTALRVHLLHDGSADFFDFLLLVFVLILAGFLVGLEPLVELVNFFVDLLLVGIVELTLRGSFGDGVLHGEGVVLKTVLGFDAFLLFLVGLFELGSITNHLLNVVLGEATLVIGDGDLVLLTGALFFGRDVEDTVGINVEGDLNLRNTAGGGRDAGEIEGTEGVVVLGHGAFTFEDLDVDSGLVVGVGGEDLRLLGGDSGVALDEGGHDTTGGLDTEGEGGDVEEEETFGLLGLTTVEDEGLDGSTVGDGLIRVDGLVEFLTTEEVRDEGLNLGDTGGATDKDDFVDGALVDLGVGEDALDGLEGGAEEVTAELLEAGTGDGGGEVDVVVEGVDFDGGLSGGGEGALSTFAGGAETAEGTLRLGEVLTLVLALELVDEVVDEAVVEVFTTKMGVTSGGLNFEDTTVNGEEGDIEGTTTEIEDEDVVFTFFTLAVETVGDGSSGGFVDDTLDFEAGDGAGVLGGLTLGVVEVGGDGDDGLLDFLAEVSFSDFLHLDEDHGRNFFGLELLLLTLVVDLDEGLVAGAGDDLEGPVLHVGLDGSVGELAADQALGVEDGVEGVEGDLVLGGVTDEAFGVGERDVSE